LGEYHDQSKGHYLQVTLAAAKLEALIRIEGVSLEYGERSTVQALQDITFSVPNGQIVTIIGPSGCGKTSLLRILARLLKPTKGAIFWQSEKEHNSVGFLFQNYTRSLLAWRTALSNVTLPLEKSHARFAREERARHLLSMLKIDKQFWSRYPAELSGGMQQRVALARALAQEPDLLLLDEPFSSLDEQTREDIEDDLLQVNRANGLAMVMVTHNIEQAVYLGDKVILLTKRPGRIHKSVEVNIDRTRHQIYTRKDKMFIELKANLQMELRCVSSE
jgi:NitT/TauT family transport system ATP-binding protein